MSEKERRDTNEFGKLFKELIGFKYFTAVQTLVIIVLSILVVKFADQKVVSIVIDKDSGATYWGAEEVTENERINQALFNANVFIKSISNWDSRFMKEKRENALWYLVPTLREKAEKSIMDEAMENIMKSNQTSYIEYKMAPQIIETNYPNVRIYANYDIIINIDDAEKRYNHHLIIDFTFWRSTPDRPSGLWVTNFEYISDKNQSRIKNILNSIQ